MQCLDYWSSSDDHKTACAAFSWSAKVRHTRVARQVPDFFAALWKVARIRLHAKPPATVRTEAGGQWSENL